MLPFSPDDWSIRYHLYGFSIFENFQYLVENPCESFEHFKRYFEYLWVIPPPNWSFRLNLTIQFLGFANFCRPFLRWWLAPRVPRSRPLWRSPATALLRNQPAACEVFQFQFYPPLISMNCNHYMINIYIYILYTYTYKCSWARNRHLLKLNVRCWNQCGSGGGRWKPCHSLGRWATLSRWAGHYWHAGPAHQHQWHCGSGWSGKPWKTSTVRGFACFTFTCFTFLWVCQVVMAVSGVNSVLQECWNIMVSTCADCVDALILEAHQSIATWVCLKIVYP